MTFRNYKKIQFAILTLVTVTATFYFQNTISAKSLISNKTNATKNTNRSSERITIMTYNVENLFDTEDDPLKNDETYLPLTYKKRNPDIIKKCKRLKTKDWKAQCLNLDWSPKALKSKMKRLADVILSSHKKQGPDIIIFQEVENLKVLEDLRKNFLIKHYPHSSILIEGPDPRGIDVAILSRLELISEPKLHNLNFKAVRGLDKSKIPTTRGILEAEFRLPDKTPLTVFGVHFPSQGTSSPVRKQALDQLRKLMELKPKDQLVVAGGDFNITSFEENKNKYFELLSEDYLVSHKIGCSDCRGTNYFHPRRSWSFLDVLIFSKNFKNTESKWQLDENSIRVFNRNLYQNNKWGSPEKFKYETQYGVSDHWPLLADIFLNSSLSNGTLK